MNNPDILIVTHNQYGYQTDYLHFSKYLSNDYNVTFYSILSNSPKIENASLNIIYYDKPHKNKLLKLLYFTKELSTFLSENNFKFILIKYFPSCSLLLNLSNKRKILVDIRSAYVSKSFLFNKIMDEILKYEVNKFSAISIISKSLENKLKINSSLILPLGGNIHFDGEKNEDKLTLIYVGTFSNRNIHLTIIGLSKFLLKHPGKVKNYYIIGDGNATSKKLLIETIRSHKLSDLVVMPGYVPHESLNKYFEISNIGVSFVPITPYYNVQPPTKTFEYLLSGIPVIATSTYENEKVVNSQNGVLIKDSAHDFAIGLEKIFNSLPFFNSRKIIESVSSFTWENIVNQRLIPFIQKTINE